MEYINYIKAKAHLAASDKSEKPVLSEEDERFLNHITSEDSPRPFTPATGRFDHGGDAQLALMDGAQNVALPVESPGEKDEELLGIGTDAGRQHDKDHHEHKHKHKGGKKGAKAWSWLRRDSRDRRAEEQTSTADSLHAIAQGLKSPDARPNEDHIVDDEEAKKEEEDMTIVLERLNLAAVNNRVFSISDETQDLLEKFNQVFKDLIQGVPTAYNDLESLLTNGDRQLQNTYNSLPPFLQKLIEKLPETMTKGFAPEMMAAASERASKAGYNMENAGKAASLASKVMKTPSLKDLVAKPSAIATMLRSILNFLKARFPAFMGMNVLWSLAMFVLLFVFWYCYKRGKEVRLEKERELTEQEVQNLDTDWSSKHAETQKAAALPDTSTDEVPIETQKVETDKAVTGDPTSHAVNPVEPITPSNAQVTAATGDTLPTVHRTAG